MIALARALQAHEHRAYPRMKPPEEIGSWYLDRILAEAARHAGLLLVAETDGVICGYAAFHGAVSSEDEPDEAPYSYAFVADLVVSEAMRGKGIGRLLMQRCEDLARAAGQRWLRLSVLASNAGARRFYDGLGLREHLLTLEKAL